METLLRQAGRQRNIITKTSEIRAAPGTDQLGARTGVVGAYAASVSALVAVITVMVTQIEVLAGQVGQGFGQHSDVEIYRSPPGLGTILGARVLAGFGDDPDRYADAQSRKNYSGMLPITRAPGTKRVVLARHVRNRKLANALYQQTFCAISSSPGARAFYDYQRERDATYHQALRALGNRLVGILHGCLRRHTAYNENTAWPALTDQNQQAA